MKRLLFLLLLASAASAQQGNLDVPVARTSVARVKIANFNVTRSPVQCVIDVFYTDASDVEIIPEAALNLRASYTVPSAAGDPCTSATAYICANGGGCLADKMNTARAGETGTSQRRQQFRVLGYLSDQGCLPNVTLVP
jgi:hypothetical protein